jgi:hypothetical protein
MTTSKQYIESIQETYQIREASDQVSKQVRKNNIRQIQVDDKLKMACGETDNIGNYLIYEDTICVRSTKLSARLTVTI